MPERPNRLHNRKAGKALRRNLRNQATPAEATLWKMLQRRQLDGWKFRRQHSVGSYILDFYCPDERLAVELDGASHRDPLRQEYDDERTAFLQGLGIRVVRFENRIVFENSESVLEAIRWHFLNENRSESE